MRGSLFGIFLLTLLIAVGMTAFGLLINWGIIPSDLVESGKALPLLDKLVTGVILAVVGLLVELGRRWFIVKNVRDELNDTCLKLIGAAVVLPTTKQEECATNFSYVSWYLSESVTLSSDEIKATLSGNVDTAVKDMMSIRYGGANELPKISETLPK
jgi:hypothetical protein